MHAPLPTILCSRAQKQVHPPQPVLYCAPKMSSPTLGHKLAIRALGICIKRPIYRDKTRGHAHIQKFWKGMVRHWRRGSTPGMNRSSSMTVQITLLGLIKYHGLQYQLLHRIARLVQRLIQCIPSLKAPESPHISRRYLFNTGGPHHRREGPLMPARAPKYLLWSTQAKSVDIVELVHH